MFNYLILLLFSGMCLATEPLRVVVLDTGLDIEDPRFKPRLCTDGHKDFTGEGLQDDDGHGTHVAGSIVKYAEDSNYCLIIVKYIGKSLTGHLNSPLLYLLYLNPDIVNLSSGGEGDTPIEKSLFWTSSSIFVVAAGNDGVNLNQKCNYFPACYDFGLIKVVGNLLPDGRTRNPSSNYGSIVRYWEVGTNIESTYPNGKTQILTGTSMATSIHTGKLIKELNAKSH